MNVSVNFPTGGIGKADVDPYISFAPGFDSTGYSLSFSDGISNAPLAPEPSTMWLSACRLLAAWMARRRAGTKRGGQPFRLPGRHTYAGPKFQARRSGLPA
jgi:hypothetical protein